MPSWFSGTQQASAGQSEVASSAVVHINPSQPADADALVDCLPPYYWEAKHMPRLVKVNQSVFLIDFDGFEISNSLANFSSD